MNNSATIIYPFRNRDVKRIRKSMLSLLEKNTSIENVLIIDYGSSCEYQEKLKDLIGDLPATLIRTETEGFFWNKSNALNLGIKNTRTKYAVAIDIDIVFNSGCIDHCIEVYSPESAIFQYYWFLPPNGDYAKSVCGGQDNCGGFMFMPTEDIIKLGGWDENYDFWGLEDKDWMNRLRCCGYDIHWLDDSKYRGYHIWHPSTSDKTMYESEAMRLRKNYTYMKNSVFPCISFNPNCLSRKDRPILDLLKKKDIKILDYSRGCIETSAFKIVSELRENGVIRIDIGLPFEHRKLERLSFISQFLSRFIESTGFKLKKIENGNLGYIIQLLEILKNGIIKDYYITENMDSIFLLKDI